MQPTHISATNTTLPTAAPISAQFATAINVLPAAPAPEFVPCPLRDTFATLSAIAAVGSLVKIVLFALTLVAGY